MVLSALGSAAFVQWMRGGFSVVFGIGAVMGVVELLAAYRTRLVRFAVLGAVAVVLGITLAAAGLETGAGMVRFWMLLGTASLCSGGFTMYRYLRRTEVVHAECD